MITGHLSQLINLTNLETGEITSWHIEEVTTDIIVKQIPYLNQIKRNLP